MIWVVGLSRRSKMLSTHDAKREYEGLNKATLFIFVSGFFSALYSSRAFPSLNICCASLHLWKNAFNLVPSFKKNKIIKSFYTTWSERRSLGPNGPNCLDPPLPGFSRPVNGGPLFQLLFTGELKMTKCCSPAGWMSTMSRGLVLLAFSSCSCWWAHASPPVSVYCRQT